MTCYLLIRKCDVKFYFFKIKKLEKVNYTDLEIKRNWRLGFRFIHRNQGISQRNQKFGFSIHSQIWESIREIRNLVLEFNHNKNLGINEKNWGYSFRVLDAREFRKLNCDGGMIWNSRVSGGLRFGLLHVDVGFTNWSRDLSLIHASSWDFCHREKKFLLPLSQKKFWHIFYPLFRLWTFCFSHKFIFQELISMIPYKINQKVPFFISSLRK